MPLIAASVKILVVSWNDAADKNESVSSDAFVIPNNTGLPVAGCLPSRINSLFVSVNLPKDTNVPSNNFESPSSNILILEIILLAIISTCLSDIPTPCEQ